MSLATQRSQVLHAATLLTRAQLVGCVLVARDSITEVHVQIAAGCRETAQLPAIQVCFHAEFQEQFRYRSGDFKGGLTLLK